MKRWLTVLGVLLISAVGLAQQTAGPVRAVRLFPPSEDKQGLLMAQSVMARHTPLLMGVNGIKALIAPVLASVGRQTAIFGVAGVAAGGRYPSNAANAYDVSRDDYIRVQIWSQAGSVAVINVDERSSQFGDALTAPWNTVTVPSINNPSTTGEYWFVPVTMNLSINVVPGNYGSGTLLGILEEHSFQP